MKKKIEIPVVILSGGKSSRMGQDKSLMPFGADSTLIEYQYKKMQKIFKNVYISSKENRFPFLKDQSKILHDKSAIYSPMVALQSITQAFKNQYIFIIAVDIPFVTQKTINTLFNKATNSSYQTILPQDNNGLRHNLCGIYHTSIYENINLLLQQDMHKIGVLIQQIKSTTIHFSSSDEFMNLNDPKQYQKALDSFLLFETNGSLAPLA